MLLIMIALWKKLSRSYAEGWLCSALLFILSGFETVRVGAENYIHWKAYTHKDMVYGTTHDLWSKLISLKLRVFVVILRTWGHFK